MSQDQSAYGKVKPAKALTPRLLIARLRDNGGPLATAAADCIEQLLSSQILNPKSQILSKLHPLHTRLILIFQSRLNKPVRDPAEMRAWAKVAPHVTPDEVTLLEQFYRARQSDKADETWSRKTAILHLLRAYLAQVELAHTWHDKRKSRQQSSPDDPTIPEPKGWQKHAIGALGERSWHYILTQYPDEAQRLHNLLSK